MKKMKTLKLTQLNKEELKKQELNSLKGGGSCPCSSCVSYYGSTMATETHDWVFESGQQGWY